MGNLDDLDGQHLGAGTEDAGDQALLLNDGQDAMWRPHRPRTPHPDFNSPEHVFPPSVDLGQPATPTSLCSKTTLGILASNINSFLVI